MKSIVVGVDASRNRSGGAIDHMLGIISQGNPPAQGIREVHIWAYRALLDKIPEYSWLVKHYSPVLEKSLLHQVWWQFTQLPRELKKSGCDIYFASDAGTVCVYRPMVVLSQDALSYEPGMMKQFGLSLARLRLILLYYIQNRSMKFSSGVIFLTNYARKLVEDTTGKLRHTTVIPHGIDDMFTLDRGRPWPESCEEPVRCVYVSNVSLYKNQWVVVRAIKKLRERGRHVELVLAGDLDDSAFVLLQEAIAECDPEGTFVRLVGAVPHDRLPELLSDSDIFIFASSCETISITLLEGMAAGLPIACSCRGPMPEVLQDAGVLFEPEDPESVAQAIEKIINDRLLRDSISLRARKRASGFTWPICAEKTWTYISQVFQRHISGRPS